jgi:hypothetical protein
MFAQCNTEWSTSVITFPSNPRLYSSDVLLHDRYASGDGGWSGSRFHCNGVHQMQNDFVASKCCEVGMMYKECIIRTMYLYMYIYRFSEKLNRVKGAIASGSWRSQVSLPRYKNLQSSFKCSEVKNQPQCTDWGEGPYVLEPNDSSTYKKIPWFIDWPICLHNCVISAHMRTKHIDYHAVVFVVRSCPTLAYTNIVCASYPSLHIYSTMSWL